MPEPITANQTLPIPTIRGRLRELYFGHTSRARKFQAALCALDVIIIGFFVVTKFIADQHWFLIADLVIAALIALDLVAKAWATGTARRFFRYKEVWVDFIVLATLLLPIMHNWAFLRILRLWALVRRERFWNTLGGGKWDDTWTEGVVRASSNLVVLIFVSAGAAQALFADEHPELDHFVDALYFAVTTLTTTGFGDITFKSSGGRIFSMILMLAGIMLFVRLAQAVVAPHRRHIRCSNCGLNEHEPDAKHCRACGAVLPARHHNKSTKTDILTP
jgi:voltage-gated potassium channel